ncbi:MAG TPA: hypothetical protein VNV87_14145 [Acidimicrobiales bacterium]|nr:hypothetical protein [Acidimicrobiales bacterium]
MGVEQWQQSGRIRSAIQRIGASSRRFRSAIQRFRASTEQIRTTGGPTDAGRGL